MPIRKRNGWSLPPISDPLDNKDYSMSSGSSGSGTVEDNNGQLYTSMSKSGGQTSVVTSKAGDVSITSYYDSNYSFRRRKTSSRGNMGTIG